MTLGELKCRMSAWEWKQWAAQFAYEAQMRDGRGEAPKVNEPVGTMPDWMKAGA